MTDMVASAASPPCSDETTHQSPKPVQLKFPTIDLNTSLESLLNHSTPTLSEASTIMPANTPHPTMDESWASLDVSDFSHDDDDTESVNTDGGSLVDLSSVHDTESAAGDESQSEMGVDESRDSVVSMLRRGLERHDEQAGQPDQQEVPPYEAMEDTIIFQQSTNQRNSSVIDMEYVRDVPWSSDEKAAAREIITMAISPNDLTSFDSPVRIFYYGSLNSLLNPQSKDELLGKIGAALLTPSSNSSSRTSTASTCFNIVPTEFGPGSKPAFADLIPSEAQMTVTQLSKINAPSDKSDSIDFMTLGGTSITSDLASSAEEADCGEVDPDLLVVLLTQEDVDDDYSEFLSLVRLAARHCWPTVIVAQDSSVAPPESYAIPERYGIQTDSDIILPLRRPVDLDTFMAMDTAQLSRHIMHIMETRFVKPDERYGAVKQPKSFSSRVSCSLPGQRKKEKRYNLRIFGNKSGSPSKSPAVPFSEKAKQLWPAMDVGKYMKDVVFTLIVMVLGIYIVGFSQNLTSKVNGLVGLDNTTLVSSKPEGTATVTATSAITTATSTAIVMDDHDIALYDPVLFDQMWHKLTGRPIADPEGERALEEIKGEEVVEEPVEVTKEPDAMKKAICQFARWVQSNLNTFKLRATRPDVPQPMKSLNKLKKKMEIRELHQKLQDFYRDVTANVPKIGTTNQGYLQDLVARSHRHLQQTRWAGEKRLERLIAEQKTLLSHAQHQAQHIVAAKKKRRSIFGRRRD